jgi:twitching motility two-component system response regulator PilG
VENVRKILIVEDAKTVSAVLQVYLMGLGFEFLVGENGAEGLKLAAAHHPALVITDVSMPVMDGFDLCAAIRADKSLFQTPVVLLTALNDELSRQKGRLVGATAFLHKPVTAKALREIVARLIHAPLK